MKDNLGASIGQLTRRQLIQRGGVALGATALGGSALMLQGCGTEDTPSSTSSTAPGSTASLDPVTLRYAHVFAPGTDQATIIDGFGERVSELTDGLLTVEIHPGGQLGADTETTQQAQQGAIDIVGTSTGAQNFVPELGLFYLPYLYDNIEHFSKIWTLGQSATSDYMVGLVEEKTNLRTLGYLTPGVRDTILRNKAINVVDDFDGVKMRVDGSPGSEATFSALGASTVMVDYAEVYQALQSGVIDAAENPAVFFVSLKWAEVAKFVSLTGHQIIMQLQAINVDKWNSLAPEYQEALQTAMDETVVEFNTFTQDARDGAIETLKADGVEVNEVDDLSSFKDATASLIQDFVDQYSLQEQYDEIVEAAGS